MNAAPKRISPRASGNGLPCSAVRIAPRSSAASTIKSNQRRKMAPRSLAVLAAHVVARRAGDRRDRGLLGRIDDFESGAVGRGDPLAADEEIGAKELGVVQ